MKDGAALLGYPLFLPVCHLVAGTECLAQRKVALEVRKHCARKRWVIPVDHHVFAVSHLSRRGVVKTSRLNMMFVNDDELVMVDWKGAVRVTY